MVKPHSSIRERRNALLSETFSRGYLERARTRATRRKSPWNLLLLPLGFLGVAIAWWASLRLLWAVRDLILPTHAVSFSVMFNQEFHQEDRGFIPLLFFIPPFFAAVPVGLLLCNAIAWCIPPARRAFAREAEGVWHASFADAQRDLATVALYISVPTLVIALVGALLLRV